MRRNWIFLTIFAGVFKKRCVYNNLNNYFYIYERQQNYEHGSG